MKSIGIYTIALNDGRCYVGQSVDIKRRFNAHRRSLRKGEHYAEHLQRCWDKYGEEAFTFSVVEECAREVLTEREEWWIANSDSAFNTRPVADSMLGYKHKPEQGAKISAKLKGRKNTPEQIERMRQSHAFISDETRAKLSASGKARMTPELRAHLSEMNKGRKLTDEHKANISAGNKGRKQTPEEIAKRVASTKVTLANRPPVKRAPVSDETRAKQSAARFAYWARRREAEGVLL